jgi:uncharacterized protein YndB with AHSA1/START domain
MVAGSNPETTTQDREIVLTRRVDAPRELVWRAWTEPEHLIHWWGPDGFTNTFHEIDVRPGGVWRFIMHGPDGTDYDNKVVFLEVVEPERLVYDHGRDDAAGAMFRATVTFEAIDGGTLVTLKSVFPTQDARDFVVREFGAIEGGNQTLARMAAYVQTM